MDARAITPVQRDLLRLFEYDHSDNFAMEIRAVLNAYFQKKLMRRPIVFGMRESLMRLL